MANYHKIVNVEADSIGSELGIEPGDLLISINNQEIEDIFDYRYLINDEYITVLIRKPDGEEWELEIEKEFEEDLDEAIKVLNKAKNEIELELKRAVATSLNYIDLTDNKDLIENK